MDLLLYMNIFFSFFLLFNICNIAKGAHKRNKHKCTCLKFGAENNGEFVDICLLLLMLLEKLGGETIDIKQWTQTHFYGASAAT
jgi:hypothetical protein